MLLITSIGIQAFAQTAACPGDPGCWLDAAFTGANDVVAVGSDGRAEHPTGALATLTRFNHAGVNPFDNDTDAVYVDVETPRFPQTQPAACFRTDTGFLHCAGKADSVHAPVIEDAPTTGNFVEFDLDKKEGIARTLAGDVTVWGVDTYGVVSEFPGGQWKAVTVANATACGITQDGDIDCWGRENKGQANFPAVPLGATWVDVECAKDICGALDSDGIVHFWGAPGSYTPAQLEALVPANPPGARWVELYSGKASNKAWMLRASDNTIAAFDYQSTTATDSEGLVYPLQETEWEVDIAQVTMRMISPHQTDICGVVWDDFRADPLYTRGDIVCFGAHDRSPPLSNLDFEIGTDRYTRYPFEVSCD